MLFSKLPQNDSDAIITKDKVYTYNELQSLIDEIQFLSFDKELILLITNNSLSTIVNYLAGLRQNHAIMLMNADTNNEILKAIIDQYQPKWIVGLKAWEGYTLENTRLVKDTSHGSNIHPKLALLLSTSGTTGSQKFVRLSYDNLLANAQSIIEYLEIDANERAIMNLPLSYSYGMSIVNSHLYAGASILLTDESVIEKPFWEFVRNQKVTSIAGVPFTYQMLQRIGFTKMELPHLKVMTQAGGRLNEKLVKYFGQYALENDKRFYVMYGQTEASPRMSYIPYEKVLEKAGTIGIAIPEGELSIVKDELVYRGANVMMGYAESKADLSKDDEMFGVLYTGDTAIVDEEGYFTITGRIKRFIKLFGLRINLDDVEKKLEAMFGIPLACTGSDDKLIVAIEQEDFVESIGKVIEDFYKLHKTAYKIKVIPQIPHFANGKTDYVSLKESCL